MKKKRNGLTNYFVLTNYYKIHVENFSPHTHNNFTLIVTYERIYV